MNFNYLMRLDGEDFVRGAYELVLGRMPDEIGVLHYTKNLASGKSRLSVLCDIAGSKEGRLRLESNGLLSAGDKFLIHEAVSQERNARSVFRWLYFPSYLLFRIGLLESAVIQDKRSFQELCHPKFPEPVFGEDKSPPLFAVRITGGVGDAVIIARFVRDFQKHISVGAEFDVYFHSPEAARFLFSGVEGFRTAIHDELLPRVVMHYDFTLQANQFVTFSNEHIKYDRLIRCAPKVLEVFSSIEEKRVSIEKYIQQHPNLDGAFSNLATKSGHRRYTYLHHMAGLLYGGDSLSFGVSSGEVDPLGFNGEKYITIHDGWDTKFKFKKSLDRPTKSLPLNIWVGVVKKIKSEFPGYKIVQIGGSTGSEIEGVDLSLKGKLSLELSVAVLANSSLHLDSESGLVHIAASMGVKSVVAFGPTNVEWFAYPDNENIKPVECGNCWWSTDTWMESCPAEHAVPICMAKHTENSIIEAINRVLQLSV